MSNSFKAIILISCLCGPLFGVAQNLQLGIKAGVSLPNLTSGSGGPEISKGYKSITGPDLALVADYSLSEKFSIESGIEWSTQGGQKSGLQTIPASPSLEAYFPMGTQYLYASFSSTVRLQYLMIPVLIKYTAGIGNSENWKFYVDGGVFGGLLLKAKATASGTSKVYLDKEETQPIAPFAVKFDSVGNISNQLHKGNFGLEGNLGLMYQMKSAAVFVEAGGNYGFINLQKDILNGVNHTGALIFRIGIMADLIP